MTFPNITFATNPELKQPPINLFKTETKEVKKKDETIVPKQVKEAAKTIADAGKKVNESTPPPGVGGRLNLGGNGGDFSAYFNPSTAGETTGTVAYSGSSAGSSFGGETTGTVS